MELLHETNHRRRPHQCVETVGSAADCLTVPSADVLADLQGCVLCSGRGDVEIVVKDYLATIVRFPLLELEEEEVEKEKGKTERKRKRKRKRERKRGERRKRKKSDKKRFMEKWCAHSCCRSVLEHTL
jgi:hypothetical protein